MRQHQISGQQAAVLQSLADGAQIRIDEGHGDVPRSARLSVEGEFFGRRLTDAVQMGTVNGLELRGLIRNITPLEKRAYGCWKFGITSRGRRELVEYQESFKVAKLQSGRVNAGRQAAR